MAANSKSDAAKNTSSGLSAFRYLPLIFAVAFAVFVLGPPFLGYPFAPYPLMHVADIFDIFTPLVIIPLYWLLFRGSQKSPAGLAWNLIFMVLAAFWVLGQGMHLSANSIDNLLHLKGLETGDVYYLTYFYDETLGHYLWHFGTIGISGLLLYREWRKPISTVNHPVAGNIIAGIIYGFVFFAMVVEGATVPMGLPFAVLALIFILIFSRSGLNQRPLTLMFLAGYAFALILFIIWGVWQHGFPGFFDAGIMK